MSERQAIAEFVEAQDRSVFSDILGQKLKERLWRARTAKRPWIGHSGRYVGPPIDGKCYHPDTFTTNDIIRRQARLAGNG